MTNEIDTTSSAINHVDLAKLFGPPPVLSSENKDDYNARVDQFLKCIKPSDFIELMFVKDLATFDMDVLRYMRHKTLLMERRFRKQLEHQAAREKIMKARKEQPLANLEPNLERVERLDEFIESTPDDVNKIFERAASEFEHARGLEDGIEYHERVDRLLGQALARRNDCLDQIGRYRDELGKNLRRASDAIIEGEFESIDDADKPSEAPLVPGGEAQ